MQLKHIQNIFHKELDEIYGKDEVNSFFYLLIEAYYNLTRIQLALNPESSISDEEESQIFNALEELKKAKPIQYVLGETEFYGLNFKVNESVLIPRPETEELVEFIIKCHSERSEESQPLKILDIGTGSGCIAVSLAKHLPDAKIYTLDISAGALNVAKQNAKRNNVEITFIEADILKLKAVDKNSFPYISTPLNNQEKVVFDSSESESGKVKNKNLKFDIIVSNPPYVRNQEKQHMQANVLNNEPHLALFVEDENPLLFYKAITEFASKNLNDKGELFFEINEYLGQEMITLLEANNFSNIELKQDVFGKDRMLKGVKN